MEPVAFRPEAIPEALKSVPHWVNWKWEVRPGKSRPTKPPFTPSGYPASHSKPASWSAFETALRALRRNSSPFAGLGFVFSEADPFGGVDLDGCRDPDTGEVAEWAREILAQLASYTEVSPSGTGLKVFLRGKLPGPGKKRTGLGADGVGAIEMYDRLRFFTVTGTHLPGTPREVRELEGAFAELYQTLFPEQPKAPAAAPTRASLTLDDAELLRRAGGAKDGAKFRALWGGDLSPYGGDRSRADLALCGLLLFWTGGDVERAERLFRQSALMRPKWDEPRGTSTYGQRTLALALSGRSDFYDPKRRSDATASGAEEGEGAEEPFEMPLPEPPPPFRKGREDSQATVLVKLALELGVELFHTPDRDCFATLPVDDHRETWRVRGMDFRGLLEREYYRRWQRVVGGQAMQDVVNLLCGMALHDGPELPVYTRIAEGDGAVYLSLADAECRAVRVTGGGWEVVSEPEVKFRRPKGSLPLPAPAPGGSLEELRALLNVGDGEWPLLVSWLVGAFRPRGPYPIALLQGEQGSAKSTTARVLRGLVDPNVAPLRAEPKEGRDLAIAAKHGWVLAYDNISTLYPWLSDALCRVATGGGLSTRELWSNDEETLFDAQRPVILTGIGGMVTRSDLLDRVLLLSLPPIPEGRRRTESEFWAEFETARPRILGALLDAVAAGLRNVAGVRLPHLPRMADFAVWATACEEGLGWPEGTFLAAYGSNRDEANSVALESCPFGEPLLKLMRGQPEGVWEGTATELLDALGEVAGERVREGKSWPKNARAFSVALERLAPNLRAEGLEREMLPRQGQRRPLRLRVVEPSPAKVGDANGSGAAGAVASGGDPGDARADGDTTRPHVSGAYFPPAEREWEAQEDAPETWEDVASLFELRHEAPEARGGDDPMAEYRRRQEWNERIFALLRRRDWGRLTVQGLGELGPGEAWWRYWIVAALPYRLELVEKALRDAEKC